MTTYILPGMGADSSMYGPSFQKLPDVKYVNWPRYNNEKTISAISKRIISENNITQNEIVGGSSLGGIVAAEISKQIATKAIILIGSTLSPESINPILKKLSALSEVTPLALIQCLAGKINSFHENKLLKMFSHSEKKFVQAMCKAVFDWEGNEEPKSPVFHIHGANDKVIFPPKNNAQILLNNGGHLIALTHEKEVSNFIRQNILSS